MRGTVNFTEPEEKRAHFTSNQKKHVIYSHNSLFLFQMGFFQVNIIVLEHV